MPYQQITRGERYRIKDMLVLGWSPAAIARDVWRARSTITRELARNRTARGRYEGHPADCYARTRRRQARRHHRVAPAMWDQVCRRLLERCSPEQIAGRLRRAHRWISYQTIYRRIQEDALAGDTLYQCLRRFGWPRQRRRSPRRRRPLGRPLDWRPAIVATRQQVGHWGIDTVQGAGSGAPCLLSAVERKTGYLVLGKLERPTAAAFARRAIQLFRRQPHRVRTVTGDNGSELSAWPVIEEHTGARFYCAPPYCAWARPTNENTNGLIRQFVPKRSSVAPLTQHDCNRLARQLNQRPRKRLGYQTPEGCYEG